MSDNHTLTKPLAYGIWAALLIPAAIGLAALIAVLVDELRRRQ